MELGASTGIFYEGDLLKNLPAIRKAGFRQVELCVGGRKEGRHLHYDWRDAEYTDRLRVALSELGLSVVAMHAPYSPLLDPAHPHPAKRNATLDELCGVGRVLKSLGGRLLILHIAVNEFDLNDRNERERRLDGVRRLLPALLEVLRPLGIQLALENLLPHLLGGDVKTLYDLIAPYAEADVGVCFDTSHAHLWGKPSVYDLLEQARPRLITTHFSDNRGKFDDHFVPGDGTVDWTKIMKILKQSKYDDVLMWEVFRDAQSAPPEKVLERTFQRGQELANP